VSPKAIALWLVAVAVLATAIWRERAAVAQHDPRLSTGESGIVMLTAEWCGYCRRQQQMFARAGVRYTALDIDTDAGDLAYRALSGRGVPITVIGQQVIRGFDVKRLREHLQPLGYSLP